MGDKKKAVNVSTEKHAAKGGGAVNCAGKCDPNHGISHNAVKQTQYEVTIQKGEGTQGQVGSSRVTGTVTLEMNGAGCANNGKSKLVIKIDAADLHKGAGQRRIGWSVDQAGSDYDGDGDTNQQEVRDKTNPLVAGS